jgi:predicted enzyme related to lactoylglutathione lyase
MTDPFDELRTPIIPLDPDPSFAARLRSRVERAFDLPRGVTVSHLTVDTPAAPALAAVTPYLAVAGADRALDWYADAFGARRRGEPIVMPDGRIGHAELEIAGGVVMLSEQHPEIGVVAPVPGQGVPVTIHLEVADVDAVIRRAVEAGADLDRPAADYDYGRNGVIRDPFGHRWLISGPVLVPAPAAVSGPASISAPASVSAPAVAGPAAVSGPHHGDVGYVSLWLPDVERAAVFYSAVLGWQYGPGSGPGGRQIQGLSLHHGMWGGEAHRTLFLCFAVADVEAAGRRVRAAGGTATAPHEEPYGRISECVDDQGVRFAVFEPPGGTAGGDRGPEATGQGNLAYVTMEVVDAARARSFYGSVLDWRFTPGRHEDGWQVDEVAPMVGISGGHAEATTIPMYRVDDIAAAVARVRAAGGTATEPEPQPYGVTASCTDDQGTRFYLGRL